MVGLDIAVSGMDGGAPRRRFTGGGDRKLLQGAGAHARQGGSNNQQNEAATVYDSGWWARDLVGALVPCMSASQVPRRLFRPLPMQWCLDEVLSALNTLATQLPNA